MLPGYTVVPGQWGRQNSRNIDHSWVVGDAPFNCCVRTDPRLELRLDLGADLISQREERLPATPVQRRNTPICGNGNLARYKVIHAALRMIANLRFR